MTLPFRRPCITETVGFDGERFHVSVGFHPETGSVCEVFAYGPSPGSALWAVVQDGCIHTSKRLSAGETPRQIAAGIRGANGRPQSVLGAIADAAVRVEAAVMNETL